MDLVGGSNIANFLSKWVKPCRFINEIIYRIFLHKVRIFEPSGYKSLSFWDLTQCELLEGSNWVSSSMVNWVSQSISPTSPGYPNEIVPDRKEVFCWSWGWTKSSLSIDGYPGEVSLTIPIQALLVICTSWSVVNSFGLPIIVLSNESTGRRINAGSRKPPGHYILAVSIQGGC